MSTEVISENLIYDYRVNGFKVRCPIQADVVEGVTSNSVLQLNNPPITLYSGSITGDTSSGVTKVLFTIPYVGITQGSVVNCNFISTITSGTYIGGCYSLAGTFRVRIGYGGTTVGLVTMTSNSSTDASPVPSAFSATSFTGTANGLQCGYTLAGTAGGTVDSTMTCWVTYSAVTPS